jgi:hypothetical protein
MASHRTLGTPQRCGSIFIIEVGTRLLGCMPSFVEPARAPQNLEQDSKLLGEVATWVVAAEHRGAERQLDLKLFGIPCQCCTGAV